MDAATSNARRRLSSRPAFAIRRFSRPETTLGGGARRSSARIAVSTTWRGSWKGAPLVGSSVPRTSLNSVRVALGESRITRSPVPRDSCHNASVKLSTNQARCSRDPVVTVFQTQRPNPSQTTGSPRFPPASIPPTGGSHLPRTSRGRTTLPRPWDTPCTRDGNPSSLDLLRPASDRRAGSDEVGLHPLPGLRDGVLVTEQAEHGGPAARHRGAQGPGLEQVPLELRNLRAHPLRERREVVAQSPGQLCEVARAQGPQHALRGASRGGTRVEGPVDLRGVGPAARLGDDQAVGRRRGGGAQDLPHPLAQRRPAADAKGDVGPDAARDVAHLLD